MSQSGLLVSSITAIGERRLLAGRKASFRGLYDTVDVLIEECEGYYSEEDVEMYGINAFEIVAVE